MSKLPLSIELVPQPCWGKNIRSELSQLEWDLIRHEVYRRAGGKCEICDSSIKLHAHEVFEYDEPKRIMKLIGLMGICGRCHEVKHYGRASVTGRSKQAREWFMVINGLGENETNEYIQAAFGDWQIRSDLTGWKIDINYLKEFWSNG